MAQPPVVVAKDHMMLLLEHRLEEVEEVEPVG